MGDEKVQEFTKESYDYRNLSDFDTKTIAAEVAKITRKVEKLKNKAEKANMDQFQDFFQSAEKKIEAVSNTKTAFENNKDELANYLAIPSSRFKIGTAFQNLSLFSKQVNNHQIVYRPAKIVQGPQA